MHWAVQIEVKPSKVRTAQARPGRQSSEVMHTPYIGTSAAPPVVVAAPVVPEVESLPPESPESPESPDASPGVSSASRPEDVASAVVPVLPSAGSPLGPVVGPQPNPTASNQVVAAPPASLLLPIGLTFPRATTIRQ